MVVHIRGELTRKVPTLLFNFEVFFSSVRLSFVRSLVSFFDLVLGSSFSFLFQVGPGDVVSISGIFLPIPYLGFRALRAGLTADTFLEAMAISHYKRRVDV